MQAEAPRHAARSVNAFLQESNVLLSLWAGNSPDMNPVENVGELAKSKIATKV